MDSLIKYYTSIELYDELDNNTSSLDNKELTNLIPEEVYLQELQNSYTFFSTISNVVYIKSSVQLLSYRKNSNLFKRNIIKNFLILLGSVTVYKINSNNSNSNENKEFLKNISPKRGVCL